jgi:Glycosyltransferase family 17
MKTWSLTPFFNEVDLLEIRLAELDDVVDIHVIAEANVSYSGRRKPLYFLEHVERFAPWKDKIRYIAVDDMPNGQRTIAPKHLLRAAAGDDNWRRENHQRNALNRGLDGMEADDKVLISDLDEILRADVVRDMKVRSPVLDRFGRMGRIRPSVTLHLYWLNWCWSRLHESPIASFVDGATVLTKGVQHARMLPSLAFKSDKASGWHFSYMGGIQAIQTKISQAAHQEVNKPVYNRRAWIEHCMRTGQDLFRRKGSLHSVPIEELPRYVGANLDRFGHLIGPPLQAKEPSPTAKRIGPVR